VNLNTLKNTQEQVKRHLPAFYLVDLPISIILSGPVQFGEASDEGFRF
jgi:hypothetical protein